MNKQPILIKLMWPILFEVIFGLSLYITDTYFLSRVSDLAASSIGSLVPLLGICIFGYQAFVQSVTSVGAQFVSAKNWKDGKSVYQILIALSLFTGSSLGAIFFLSRNFVGKLLGFSELGANYIATYLGVLAVFLVFQVMKSVFGAILSSMGKPQYSMFAAVLGNSINIALNILVLNNFLVHKDATAALSGVAWATSISQIAACAFLFVILILKSDIHVISISQLQQNAASLCKSIFKVAGPGIFEPISVELMFLVHFMIVVRIGAQETSAHNYTLNITMFIVAFSNALGIANQIVISHQIGKRELLSAYAETIRTAIGVCFVVVFLSCLLFFFSDQIMSIFTKDQAVLKECSKILFVNIFVQIGIAINTVIGMVIRATKDSKYSALMSVSVMWLVGVPLVYLFGAKLGFGLLGVWIARCIDECIRAFLHVLRFKKKVWMDSIVAVQL